jgi:antitoxin (DNA-binding transcriptional repressor) of toxin-antitoxin stability system
VLQRYCPDGARSQLEFYRKNRRTFTIGDLKTNFSKILELVRSGEDVAIVFGKKKEIVAYIVPRSARPKKKRPLGMLEGAATVQFHPDFKLTEEEFLGL